MKKTEPGPEQLEDEIATTAARLNATTARWLELVLEFERGGGAAVDGVDRWLAFRCGISAREAREYVRVARALEDLPVIRSAFRRGALSFSKVRALTKVAAPSSERALLDLAAALTASQLERALRAYRRLTAEEARDSHELEYVDYHWGEDGSLFLRARLPAEDGMLLVHALDAARERVRERRREAPAPDEAVEDVEPPRPGNVEAIVELAHAALAAPENASERSPRVVVHVDAAALVADAGGRSELEDGPVVSPETARRLACDSEWASVVERDGLPLGVGRKRRTVPPKLRRVLEARDDGRCRWPGCERRRHLQAHHRRHWAHGGETSVENLVLLCWHHHRLVHEGGYRIEDGDRGRLHFRNRHGLLCPSVPRSPPGNADALFHCERRSRVEITAQTIRNGVGDPMDLALTVAAMGSVLGAAAAPP